MKKQQTEKGELSLIDKILLGRGYKTKAQKQAFLHPDYDKTDYDPMLLPSMKQAVDRLIQAIEQGQKITIYNDYDVDGTTAAAVLLDALPKFGAKFDYYVPDRFSEGYVLNKSVISKIKKAGTDLLLTVDNGIVSFDEVDYANSIGLDIIITDHHTPRSTEPSAIGVVNPKLLIRDHAESYDHLFCLKKKNQTLYPFGDLCGCGVAFKLVQALMQRLPDCIPKGQEKWLLDLVALATVSDMVGLVDENRAKVYWGLKVLAKTRRPGMKALAAVADIDLNNIDTRKIGFVLGPRINAAGRLANARLAVDLLSTDDNQKALKLATELNELNSKRKKLQNDIYESAITQVANDNPVAIVAGENWHEGVVGIVASRIVERVQRPAFVFSISPDGKTLKASGRSFGDFSIVKAIQATNDLLIKGGGHAGAGGVTIANDNFPKWQKAINEYYLSLNLQNQLDYLLPNPDVTVNQLNQLTVKMVQKLAELEPYGVANPEPTFLLKNVGIASRQTMGDKGQHVRYSFVDSEGDKLTAVAFGGADRFSVMPSMTSPSMVKVDALVHLYIDNWNGTRGVQGKLLALFPSC